MKKNLIALAVAAGIAAPMAASADATIYGVMDMEAASMSDGDKSGLFLTSRNSRIGFKGKEDLGMGGTSAIWQVETDLDSATNNIGGQSWAGRNTFVGLTGGWGTVIAGKHDTPYKIIGRKVELFGHHMGDFRSVTNFLSQDARLDNMVAYIMPTISGVGLSLGYVFPDSIEYDTTDGKVDPAAAYSGSLSWTGGPIYVAGAIQHIDKGFVNGQGTDLDNVTDGIDSWRLAFKYAASFGLKVTAMYSEEKEKYTVPDVSDLKNTTYGAGIAYTFGGKHTIKGQYYMGQVEQTILGTKLEPKASLAAIGYDFSMSKKTTLYAEYALVDNKDGADAALYNGTVPPAVDDPAGDPLETYKNPNGLGIGIKVKF